MSLVIDGSATLAWTYSEETTAANEDVFARVAETGTRPGPPPLSSRTSARYGHP